MTTSAVSCHTGCLNTMVSWLAVRHRRPALDHPGGAHQWDREQPEHPTAAHRGARAQRYQTREPRQTFCAVGRQRSHLGGGVLSAHADVLLRHLALQTLVLVMDGSGVGRGCTALMLHVVYKGRALPLAWRVRQAPKGHFPEDLHIALVELISGLIPTGAQVVLLGDGEFDGTALQDTLNKMGWSYVCRTAMSTTATWNGQTFRLDTRGRVSSQAD